MCTRSHANACGTFKRRQNAMTQTRGDSSEDTAMQHHVQRVVACSSASTMCDRACERAHQAARSGHITERWRPHKPSNTRCRWRALLCDVQRSDRSCAHTSNTAAYQSAHASHDEPTCRTHVAFASSAVTHAHTHAVQARTHACTFDDGAERQRTRARHAAARPAFNQSSHTRASQSLRATRSVRRCLRRTARSPSPGHLRARCARGSSADVARSR